MLTDIDVSYKTIERLYSDPDVYIALINLHCIIMKKKGINMIDATGDGTGCGLSISRHYATTAQKLKDNAKNNETASEQKKDDSDKILKPKAFLYSFRLIDLKSQMYVAHGSSLKSEKEAFVNAMKRLEIVNVVLNSIRLDRYYSASAYLDYFKDANVFVIPKTNATMNGSWTWKRTMMKFVANTNEYLEEYYKRNHSESGFSADKRMLGDSISQRLPERMDCAQACSNLWHNLFRFGS